MKNPTAKLSSNGQIVIPRKIRASLGLNPGAKFLVTESDDNIVLKPIKDNVSQKGVDMPGESDNSPGTN